MPQVSRADGWTDGRSPWQHPHPWQAPCLHCTLPQSPSPNIPRTGTGTNAFLPGGSRGSAPPSPPEVPDSLGYCSEHLPHAPGVPVGLPGLACLLRHKASSTS